ELRDRSPAFLFGGDRLVRGEFRADVLEHPIQHGPRGGVGVIGRVRGNVGVVGGVGCDVGVVPVAAAGHRDVEVLLGGRGRGQDVGGVDGDALGAVRRDGVAQLDMLRHIPGGQHHRPTSTSAGGFDGDGAVVVDGGGGPAVALADVVLPVARPQPASVRAGQHVVAGWASGAVMQLRPAGGGDSAVGDEVAAGSLVELRQRLPGFGDDNRGPYILGV